MVQICIWYNKDKLEKKKKNRSKGPNITNIQFESYDKHYPQAQNVT